MCKSPQLLFDGKAVDCGCCDPCFVARRLERRDRLRAMFSKVTWKGGSYG